MEKRMVKNSILLFCIVAYTILYKLVIFPHFMKYSDFVNASFLSALFALSVIFLGFRKDKNTIVFQNVFKYTVFYLFITGFTIYGIGFFVGFLKNAYSRELLTLFDNIFTPIIICCLIELIRYVFIWANKDKKFFVILFTIILIVMELCFKVRALDFGDFEAVFRFASSIFLPTVIKSLFFTYICYHVGYKIPIFYRLLVDVFYVYIVPIIPDLGEYLHSIVSITLPVLIYINIYEMIDSKSDKPRTIFPKNAFSVADFGIGAFLFLLIAMISGLFPIYMIGIGSSSMSPTINKGDAVILQKVNGETGVKEGDIIAYSKTDSGQNTVVVVHRITKVTKDSGKKAYVTKGDANNSVDVNFVKPEQVKGVVRLRIPFLAYPTIFFKDFIQNWR